MACVDGTTVTFDEAGGFRVKLKTNGGILPNGGTGPTDGLEGARRRIKQTTASSQVLNVAATGVFGYAITPILTFTNPSTVFPMMVTAQMTFSYAYQLFASVGTGGTLNVTGYTKVNGSVIANRSEKFANFDYGNLTVDKQFTHTEFIEVAAGGSFTLQSGQTWTSSTSGAAPYFFTAYSDIVAYGQISQNV